MAVVSPVSSIPEAAFASMDSMMGAAPAAAAGAGIKGTLGSIWKFLGGEWGSSVGKAYRTAKLADSTVKITNFDWGKAYSDYFAGEAAKKAAEATAGTAAKTGFFGKLFSGIGKKLGVIFNAIIFLPRIFNAFKEGGIGEGLKETAKAALSLVGFALGAVVVGMFGLGAVAGFFASAAVAMAVDWGANKILGESVAEQNKQMLAQQEELQKNQGNFDVFKNDPAMAILKRRFDERNNYLGGTLLPYGQNYDRSQYYA